jgi:Tol biopolymer transport system component
MRLRCRHRIGWNTGRSVLCAVAFHLIAEGLACALEGQGEPSPYLKGQLLFHRYSRYEAWDSKLYLLDFAEKSLNCLSDQWPIDHAMNAHFSPDGKRVVFMGVPRGKLQANGWDIYLWDLGSPRVPANLTRGNGLRDEDPKFSPNGKTIVFKQDGQVQFMNLNGKNLRPLPRIKARAECSMPIFTADGKRVVVMEGAGKDGDLYVFDVEGTARTAVAATPGVQEYYPVAWDVDRLLYVRWHSAENRNDQIYFYSWKMGKAAPISFCMPDANDSDPWPLDSRWLVFSSTSAGGQGGYDLYVGDTLTNRVFPVRVPGINTRFEELGSCYRPRAGQ